MVENCKDEFLKFDLEYDQVSSWPFVYLTFPADKSISHGLKYLKIADVRKAGFPPLKSFLHSYINVCMVSQV
jgi:hypothetical protein